mgnify:CR=1 FL=1
MEFYNFIKKYHKNKVLISMFKDTNIDLMKLERSSREHKRFLKDNLRMTSIEL